MRGEKFSGAKVINFEEGKMGDIFKTLGTSSPRKSNVRCVRDK